MSGFGMERFKATVRDGCHAGDYLKYDAGCCWWVPTTEEYAEALATQAVGPLGKALCVRTRTAERFWAYTYVPELDGEEWREYTREALLDELVIVALRGYFLPLQLQRKCGMVYGGQGAGLVVDPGFKLAEMVKRIAAAGRITPSEFEAIKHEWRAWWAKHGPSVRLARNTDAVHRDAFLSAVGASSRRLTECPSPTPN